GGARWRACGCSGSAVAPVARCVMAFSRERQRLPRAHPQVFPEPESEQGKEGSQDRASRKERAREEQNGHDGPRSHHAPPEATAIGAPGEQARGTGGVVARVRSEGLREEDERTRQQEEAEDAGERLHHARIAGGEDGGGEGRGGGGGGEAKGDSAESPAPRPGGREGRGSPPRPPSVAPWGGRGGRGRPNLVAALRRATTERRGHAPGECSRPRRATNGGSA